jgi:hypothetical protein
MSKIIKIKATVMWAFLNRRNDLSDSYQVELTNLSNSAVNALEELGVTVNKRDDKPEKGFYIACKSKKYPIGVMDEDGNDLDPDSIGNGTKVIAAISTYEWKFKNKVGVSPTIVKNGLVVTELVTYTPDTGDVPVTEEAL